jgi:hypothetical protein
MLRILQADLASRAALLRATPTLDRLAARLERLLGGLTAEAPYIPADKALLSRDGGVCPEDGSRLAFDPDAPHAHTCARCGTVVTGPRHHRAWVTRYQLWLSERAVHLALLGALRNRSDLATAAARVLLAYETRYRDYPNEDNVLGPTRPFFSTYLESIWLAQLSTAASLVKVSAPDALTDREWRAVAAMLEESAALVGSFDEGWSNRQVWNATALAGAGLALEDDRLLSRGRELLTTLLGAINGDGWWWEGENYHLFALRGFVFGAELLRWAGDDLYAWGSLGRMYGAPLDTLLPDLTVPARGDAPFGVTVRQPRFAELWEIGRARAPAARLDAVLARLYGNDAPDGPDRGRVEIAEQDENQPPARQYRERLGWKALLLMPADDPRAGNAAWGGSVLFEQHGAAILRPGQDRMVLLECGRRSGGHAHPDRLHLSLYWGAPALADFGTGSYVSPSLHWYRSTLAHNAPGVVGRGQEPVMTACDGWAADGDWRWCRARAAGLLGDDTDVIRSVLAGRDWVLDVVTVRAPEGRVVDLPLHPLAGAVPSGWALDDAPPPVDAGHETGYDRLRGVEIIELPRSLPLLGSGDLVARLVPRAGETVLSAVAPGPPAADVADGPPMRFLIRRAPGCGRWVQLYAPAALPVSVVDDRDAIEIRWGEQAVRIRESDEGLAIAPEGGSPIRLAARSVGPSARPPAGSSARRPAGPPARLPLWPPTAPPFADDAPVLAFTLGAAHYRRSEQPYGARGPFRADVSVAAQEAALWFLVRVTKPEVVVRALDAADPALDNEVPEIHSDGVQVYVGTDQWIGVLALPDLAAGALRAQAVRGTAPTPGPVTGWSRRMADGYEVALALPTGRPLRRGDRVRFTVTVNEMAPGRERRAGQLALAGGRWVWLRGDREAPETAVVAEIA